MLLKALALVTAIVAQRALVRLLPSVNAQVRQQVGAAGETLAAVLAAVGLLARVDQLVDLQRRVRVELLEAVGALQVVGVPSHVLSQLLLR